MRWIPFLVPIALAITVVVNLGTVRESGTGIPIVIAICVVGLALAAFGSHAARANRSRAPGTFLLCWIMCALAMLRVVVELAWVGAHATIDMDAVTGGLVTMWFTLAIGILCGIAGIAVGRPRTAE